MLSKKLIARRIPPKPEMIEYRQVVRDNPPAYLCFCFNGTNLKWCDEFEDRRPCIHKCHEVTPLFYQWLDGDMTKAQLVTTLYELYNR